MRKLDEDNENTKVKTINKALSKKICETRLKNKMKQAELAREINVLPSVLQKYENGTAIPDIKIILKLEKKLKVKLTGKEFK